MLGRRTRIGAGAFLALSFALVAPALPLAASPAGVCDDPEAPLVEPIEVCGDTVITGTGPSVVGVRLTETVTIRGDLDAEFAGDAAIAGFALVDEGWTRAYLGGIFPDIPNLEGAPRFFALGEHDGVPSSETFPPGEYDLFLLADGSPVTVTLRLRGLPGRVDLSPTTAADYRGGLLPPRYSVPTGHYYSADRTESLPLGGLGVRIAWIQSEGPGDAQAGTCRSNSDPELGWLECGGIGTTSLGAGPFGSYETAAEMFEPGLYNQGGVAFSAAATVHSVGVFAIWLGRT